MKTIVFIDRHYCNHVWLSNQRFESCGTYSAKTAFCRFHDYDYNMVRIMAGTLLEIGLGKRSAETIAQVFETKNRELAGETLPGKGLTLLSVEYE